MLFQVSFGDSLNSEQVNNRRQHKLCISDTTEFHFMINYVSLAIVSLNVRKEVAQKLPEHDED